MISKIARAAALALMLLMAGCGSETFLFPMRKEISDFEIKTFESGKVLFPGDGLPIEITTADSQKDKSMDLLIAVFTSLGAKVWESRLTAMVVNEPLPTVQLPDLKPGQYRLELSLSSSGTELNKKTVVFFSSGQTLRITGIKSFPAGITVSSSVLLKADLEAPVDADPYLRWSWRGKTIAEGSAAKGFRSILWSAPAEEGIYTVTLELFPIAPMGVADIPYRSSLSMSTDIYVSTGKTLVPIELGPDGSYYALYHFRADLLESGTAEKKTVKTDAAPLGAAEIVATDYGFGYRLHDGAGILIPWSVFPAGAKRPFTVSLSVRLEASDGGMRLLHIENRDGSISFSLDTDASLSPHLVISIPGSSLVVPSDAVMEKDKRHLLSVSIVPIAESGFSVQWFVDGEQTAQAAASFPFPELKDDGKAVIGGDAGFKGTVDEFGVYIKDEKGKDSPDPSLYRKEAERTRGDALVLAEGFDGVSLPPGFAVRGTETPALPVLGSLSIAPATTLELPPVKIGDAGIDAGIRLGEGSAQEAVLAIRFKGEDETALETRISARGGSIEFSIKDGRISFDGPDGTQILRIAVPKKPTDVVFSLTNPKETKTRLVIESILAVKQKE
jgi:hypothetical protein